MSAAGTPERLLEVARTEVGYIEQPTNRTKFAALAGHINGQPWCATYIVAMARAADVELPSESAYTPTMAHAFKTAGRWFTDPQPGDLVFFDFSAGGDPVEHAGIVEQVRSDGSIVTLEGNTSPDQAGSQVNGGGVYRRARSRRLIVGFGRPAWKPAPPTPSPEDDDMRPIAGTPSWCKRNLDSNTFPRFQASYELMGSAAVVSIDHAEFEPEWVNGQRTELFEDFAAPVEGHEDEGIKWWRRFFGAGQPYGFDEVDDGSFFLLAEHGTYDVAKRP